MDHSCSHTEIVIKSCYWRSTRTSIAKYFLTFIFLTTTRQYLSHVFFFFSHWSQILTILIEASIMSLTGLGVK